MAEDYNFEDPNADEWDPPAPMVNKAAPIQQKSAPIGPNLYRLPESSGKPVINAAVSATSSSREITITLSYMHTKTRTHARTHACAL